jgi:hypothetical protein
MPPCVQLMPSVESVEKAGLPLTDVRILSREPGVQDANMGFREG